MKLILIRHGESVCNKNQIVEGFGQSELTEKGHQQAQKLTQRLKKFQPDVIFSSDLQRVVQTAIPTINFHEDIPLFFSEKLREYYFGENEGQTYASFEGDVVKSYTHPSCESVPVFMERTKQFFDQLKTEHQDKTVLIFTHAWTILAFLAHLQNRDFEDLQQELGWGLKNTSVTIIEGKDLKLYNCTKHLK